MKRWTRNLIAVLVLTVVFLAGLTGGLVLQPIVASYLGMPTGMPAAAAGSFRLLAEAWNTIERVYVDRSALVPQRLGYGALRGLVDALGDTGHSTFLTPEMVKQQQDLASGHFEGIGAYVQLKDGHVVIATPMDKSPAQKAGLQPGDIILQVDGQSIAGLPLEDVVARVVGPAGTQVTLTILTPSTGNTRDVTLQRANIVLQNVTWVQIPGTTLAHLRMAGFSQGVSQDLITAIQAIQEQHLTGIVLDLRNNPGGLLDEAVGTASQFLTSGNVLQEKDAQGRVQAVPVRPGGAAADMPLVVLINEGTASAAEIVAGALQDAHRATIVGETTFGTGTVLRDFPLSDGSALVLAIEEWLTPNGRVIWHQGLAPDVTIALPPNGAPLLPEEERTLSAEQLAAGGDAQLLHAVQVLGQ
jgi:carboxyl-terminal processing protease